ncbi:PREDICTED: syntaxin-17 [Nicrophorus vespilloides]|uniref:Syntaxin-17 n=1 Tax=Nicrophorus vespilloides TaxID=110193 RepID=A0ABM1MJN4_NICVS|nr:PREDICTED: syntaxin-17 [Nicrophorus vespilloides]
MSACPKQPFKVIEIPLNKFNEEAVPHHQYLFEEHQKTIQKLISGNKTEQLVKEIRDKKKIVRQLKDLQYELDTLRAQVQNIDLGKFDEKTVQSLKLIARFLKEYSALEKQVTHLIEAQNEVNENIENENPFQAAGQLQIHANIEDLRLQDKIDTMVKVEALEVDVQDLQGMYVNLNQMVGEQAETVDVIESNVEGTQESVNQGLKSLMKASKLKTAAYPMTGALLGTLLGGPLGLVAGFKVGGIAAVGCGVAGYAGGKFFKKCNDTEDTTTPVEIPETNKPEEPGVKLEEEHRVDKKDK